MPYSLDRFIRVFEMLLRLFEAEKNGTEKAKDLFRRILHAFGEGLRIRVPLMLSRHPLHSGYYWNIDRGQNPTLFRNVHDLLQKELGPATGAAVFKELIHLLGPGDKVTVPAYKCEREHCSREQCGVDLCFRRELRNEQIRAEYHAGAGYEELSLTWSLSKRNIRRIVNE